MESVRSNLDETQYWICGLNQYTNLFRTAVGYTITASGSAVAIRKSNYFHKRGHDADCMFLETYYMIGFGVIEIILSQLPNFHELRWLSIVASSMSFICSLIAIGLSIAKIASGHIGHTIVTRVTVGVDHVTQAEKVWGDLQALGNIAFAYSYSMILIEIQDTLKSPPAENKAMKKATLIGVSTTTIFYFMSGCLGYAAFGNSAPGNMVTGFGFYEPFWFVNIANMCIFIHLIGAYQVYSQPLYTTFENWLAQKYPDVKFFSNEYPVIDTKCFKFNLNPFRLIWRTIFVIVSTVLGIAIPFFNDVLGFLGAVGFCQLTVYFPTEMYIKQKKIKKFSTQWILMESLSLLCLIVSVVQQLDRLRE